ncbi:MAG: transaldolase family protein [Spirochaetota bacterium]
MKIYLDSANLEDVSRALESGMIDGVTTNPSIIAREGRPFKACIEDILRMGPRLTVLAEVVSGNAAGMEAEARDLASLGAAIVIKLPCTAEGISAARRLSGSGIRTTVTLVFSLNQAIAAACAGADFVAPFVGRLDDIDSDGIGLVRSIKETLVAHSMKTQVIAASVRSPFSVSRLFIAGADIVTLPFKLLGQMIQHPLTDQGMAAFERDWAKVPG